MESNQAKKQKILISAETVVNNNDLLTEILVRLPTKPLVKFKCVSKQWLSLISNPQFSLSHTRYHHTLYPTPTAILLKESYIPTPHFQFVPLKQPQDDTMCRVSSLDYFNAPHVTIKQSCNGLLLLQVWKHGCPFDSVPSVSYYYICNPTTKKFKKLSFPDPVLKTSLISVNLAFDPLKSNHYKVICVCNVIETNTCLIYMYSSEMDSWSSLGNTFTRPNRMEFCIAVFCNGAVHWFSNGETSLYFDVDRECLNTMPMPDLANHVVRYFGESRGHLHLIRTENPYCLQLAVLEMTTDYSEWFVRYHVNLDAVRIAFPEIVCYPKGFSILHIIQAQKEEESIVVVFVDNKIISCNVHDGTSKKLYDLKPGVSRSSYYTWRSAFQYFESLTSV